MNTSHSGSAEQRCTWRDASGLKLERLRRDWKAKNDGGFFPAPNFVQAGDYRASDTMAAKVPQFST